MAELKDRMMDDNFGIHSTAPMVNALEGGQMGPLVNQGKYIQNAHYIKKNVIVRVIEFPRWVQYMEAPDVFRRAIKTFFEVHSKVDGLNKALTAEFAETAIGAAGHRQFDLTKVSEEQSEITHTVTEKYGQVYKTLLDFWMRYGMQDPAAQVPLVSILSDEVTDALPDLYCATVLYYEPDPLHRHVQNAWLCTNMAPRLNGPDDGRKDLEAPGETVEMGIGFTSLQQCSYGVKLFAQEDLDRLNRTGLNPLTRKSFATSIDADVEATKAGYHDYADAAATEQL